jgi:type IV secretion system protein VirB8
MNDMSNSVDMPDPRPVSSVGDETFFAEALGWEADREARREKSERRAWRVAAAALLLAVIAVTGIATLAPFRRNVPYLFAMEKTTGNVEFVGAIDDRRIAGYQELLDKHWGQRYIVARESYNYKLLQSDYDTVIGMSNEPVGRDFARLYEGAYARDAKYGASIEMRVTILSVQLSANGAGSQAVIRFAKATRRVDADSNDAPQYFVATIAYEYKPTMAGKEKDLIANPLGYRVTSYRVDSEIAPIGAPSQKSPTS